MTIFESLLMAHLIGDWLLQTEWQAVNKKTNWKALLLHILIYHAVVFLILFFGFNLKFISIIVAVVFLGVLHTILDMGEAVPGIIKVLRINVNRPPQKWLNLAVDQSIHILLLGVASLYLSASA
jgi:fatty acid desaturase